MKSTKAVFKQYPYMITEKSFTYPMCQEQIIDCNLANETYMDYINEKISLDPNYKPNQRDERTFMRIFYARELNDLKNQ